jgi:hypothetical protein
MRGGQADRSRELDVASRGNVGRRAAKLQEGQAVNPALVADLQAPRLPPRTDFNSASVNSRNQPLPPICRPWKQLRCYPQIVGCNPFCFYPVPILVHLI